MSNLTLAGRTIRNVEVERFKAEPTPHGLVWNEAAGKKYGQPSNLRTPARQVPPDSVFLTDGKTVYVASKRGMGPDRYLESAKLDGRELKVIGAHDNLDTTWDKVKDKARTLWAVVVFVVVAPFTTF